MLFRSGWANDDSDSTCACYCCADDADGGRGNSCSYDGAHAHCAYGWGSADGESPRVGGFYDTRCVCTGSPGRWRISLERTRARAPGCTYTWAAWDRTYSKAIGWQHAATVGRARVGASRRLHAQVLRRDESLARGPRADKHTGIRADTSYGARAVSHTGSRAGRYTCFGVDWRTRVG